MMRGRLQLLHFGTRIWETVYWKIASKVVTVTGLFQFGNYAVDDEDDNGYRLHRGLSIECPNTRRVRSLPSFEEKKLSMDDVATALAAHTSK